MPGSRATAKSMFSYRLHLADGSKVCDVTCAAMSYPGEEIIAGDDERFRVVAVVPFEDEHSPFVGMLQVEAA